MNAPIPRVTAKPRSLNERFWQLLAAERAGTITPQETAELNEISDRLEGEAA